MTANPKPHPASSIAALLSWQAIDKREAQMLLAHVLGLSRALIIAHPERLLDATQEQVARSLISRRAAGEPIAYLLGTREFYGRDFVVSPATLIPRPETELIIEQALVRLSSHLLPVSRPNASVLPNGSNQIPHILDLGTGSGVIAVSLALERPDACVVAADSSSGALKIAAENAQRLGANVEFVESDWYARLKGRQFDLIVSNPPYVAGGDEHLSQGDLRFEPQVALTDESSDGLRSIRAIIEGAPTHLNSGGWLLFEHGYDQAGTCHELLAKAGFKNIMSTRDLAGISRVAGGQIG